jgi:hypothetical protein
MHKACALLYQPFRCNHVVMQTNLQTLFVVNNSFPTAVFTSSWLTFMPKLTNATAKHTKVCRRCTSASMTSKLLEEHHVGYYQHFYKNLILFSINNAELLLFYFHKRINELLKERHHVRLGTIASYRWSVKRPRLVHVSFVPSQLLGNKAAITLLRSTHRDSLARERNACQITCNRNDVWIVGCRPRVPCIEVQCFYVPVDAFM